MNPIRLRTAAPIVAWSLVALGVSVPVSGAEYPPPPEREIPAPLAGLSDDFESILHTYRWPRAHWSVLVVSMDRGDTLFAEAPDAPMAPASNLKLLTTAAALRTLGPSFRFRTYLLADGEVREGVLHGDLVLYGTGDPSISDRLFPDRTEVFRRLAEQLEALGIHTITGDLVGDASFLSGPRHPEGWDRKDLNDAFAAPVSALSFNENVLSFRVVPSRTAGEAPTVHTIPARGGMVVVNNARTVTSRTGPRLAILRDHPDDAVRIEGRIRKGSRDVWRQMTVSDPALFATLAL
ncbi:MAG: D-alanyl-D-alanine carboxypeptidase/D-alanyl-D-alanine-endopeptidase, partial [Gemmatimonadota bacterium]|nr:D-alanyl-D-alanine carboxypeptidase/D-alanyl-D-alanine-endopeptidase [Gemmatimonadota bacterium]